MKKIITILGILLLSIGLVNAVSQEELNEAKSLIDSKVACNQLFNEQLEIIGEYYMEQMHPGESHELMHKMMGLEEGSEAEEQFHINMAKRLYCNENVYVGYGMMGSGGMMNMMGGYPLGYSYANGYWNIFWILLLAGVIFLIAWIVYRLGMKNTASETPLNILKKRYALEEITKKQYEQMKKELK